jgi:protein-tyrosine-phosphatase/DNA-binding HxlR family transcriptional regulator
MNIEESIESRAQVLSALGDPVRLGVVDLLRLQDLSPDALANDLHVPGNLLAHHLKVLEAAGVIERLPSQHDRRRVYVHLVDGALDGLLPAPAELAVPRVVFVCTHNSARSVLAEALWRESSDVPAASAGTEPAAAVNPKARAAATAAGLDVGAARPRSIDEVLRPDDLVVSVCDSVNEELAPIANPHIHWSVPDPSRVGTARAFTDAVTDLRDRVHHLAPRVTHRNRPHRKADR